MRGFSDFSYFITNTFSRNIIDIRSFRTFNPNGYTVLAKVLNNKIYVPTFMDKEVQYIIEKEGFPKNSDIIYNITSHSRETTASTTANILKKFFNYSRYSNFTIVRTTKGYEYRGTKGVVLDYDYKPLIICCNVYDIVDERIQYCNSICLISPRVFNNTDLVSKFIVKSLISNITDIAIEGIKISVQITDFIDDFVNSPKAPVNMDFNESIYQLLKNHVNEIIDEPQGILQGLDNSDTL